MEVIFEKGRSILLTFVKKKKKSMYYFDCYLYDFALNNSAFVGTALYNKKDGRCYLPKFPIAKDSPISGEKLQEQIKDEIVQSIKSLDYVFEGITY